MAEAGKNSSRNYELDVKILNLIKFSLSKKISLLSLTLLLFSAPWSLSQLKKQNLDLFVLYIHTAPSSSFFIRITNAASLAERAGRQ
jgi:hypothetical protein